MMMGPKLSSLHPIEPGHVANREGEGQHADPRTCLLPDNACDGCDHGHHDAQGKLNPHEPPGAHVDLANARSSLESMTVGTSAVRCDHRPAPNFAVVQKMVNLRRAFEREMFYQHLDFPRARETDDLHQLRD